MAKAKRKPINEVLPETLQLEKLLIGCEVGKVIRYETLTAAIHMDVTRSARHLLQSALRRVLREHRIAYECVYAVGYKRLNDVGKVNNAGKTIGKIRRAAKRGLRTVLSVQDFDAMPAQTRLKHNMMATLFGLTRAITGKRQQRLLSARLANSKPLSTQDVKAIVAETLPRRAE